MPFTRREFASVALAVGTGGCTALGADREIRVFSVPSGGTLDVVWVGPDAQQELIEQFHAGG